MLLVQLEIVPVAYRKMALLVVYVISLLCVSPRDRLTALAVVTTAFIFEDTLVLPT